VTRMIAAALGYAEAGWPVFPVVWRGKEPLTAHGFKDASTDPAIVSSWWRRWPSANVAVATGAPGPDVVDVDVKNGAPGMELYERASRAGLLRGSAAVIRTPSAGLHIWFEGTDQTQGAIGPRKALELKARGGYVVLPPSYVETDKYAGRYELIEEHGGGCDRGAAGADEFAGRGVPQPDVVLFGPGQDGAV
jgi:Bifunctional DNA primase/polymerase, N-terminal